MFRLFIKKWIYVFVITVFAFVIGMRVSSEFFYFFFWFLTVFIALSLLWVATQYFFVKLYLARHAPKKAIEDEVLEVETKIRNRSFLPAFNIVIEDHLSCAAKQENRKWILLEYLGPRSSSSLKYGCICYKRGKYRLGRFTVYFFDPFNLFFFKKTYHIYSELYVYPRTFNIRKFPPLAKGILPWFGIETTHVSGDEDEFFGVREYKEGDPIKRIHWLSTARKRRLIVKEFQRQSFQRATIIFNLEKDKNFGEGKETVGEYAVKIAASVARYLIRSGISVEIIAHVGEIVHIPFNKGSEHLEDIMRFLAIAEAESRVSLAEIFEEFYRYISNDSSLIVIMTDDDWKYMPGILALEKRNVSLIPLILIGSTFLYAADAQRFAREAKMVLYQSFNFNPRFVSRGDNLEEIFTK